MEAELVPVAEVEQHPLVVGVPPVGLLHVQVEEEHPLEGRQEDEIPPEEQMLVPSTLVGHPSVLVVVLHHRLEVEQVEDLRRIVDRQVGEPWNCWVVVLRMLGAGKVDHHIAEVEMEALRIVVEVPVVPFQVLEAHHIVVEVLEEPFQVLVVHHIVVEARVGPFQVLEDQVVQEAYLPVAYRVDLRQGQQHCHPVGQNA